MDISVIRLGVTNTYLVKGNEGYVMIDAGQPHKQKKFFKRLKKNNIRPEEIKLIIITHCHFDHVGSLAEINNIINAPVLMHPLEANSVSRGDVVIPPGTNLFGKILSTLGKRLTMFFKYTAFKPDIIFNEDYSLKEYGINAKVIHVPGHTLGSLAIIFDDGRAIVGDSAMNFPMHSNFPIFAEQPSGIYEVWRKLKKMGVNKIYPAHGKSFSIRELERLLPR